MTTCAGLLRCPRLTLESSGQRHAQLLPCLQVCFGSKTEVARFEKFMYGADASRFQEVAAQLA